MPVITILAMAAGQANHVASAKNAPFQERVCAMLFTPLRKYLYLYISE
ncbi:hypothetical protein BN136_2873 [Cronobacter universalis NCTC 9529]|nr:hypothetical protein BN136_2873 [Cronobacter universalis NCTC 9529]